ncbi:MAG: hypothetical protein K2G45_07850 [Lachnospiraceae bacterium]|nr:hypothetical protein [Lachnospiraceae bacterium]
MKLNLYEIRLLKREEYDKMVDFIRCHWSEKHIFCKHREIFEFQHGQAEQGNYDFVIAVHKESSEIHAVLGYITSSLYDKSHGDPQAIYGALWKVRDDVKNKEIGKLGLGVLYYLIKMYPHSAYITLGLSQDSQHIYNALHFGFGVMNHYYIANPSIKDYVIAANPISEPNMMLREDVVLERLNEIPEIKNTFFPNKNSEYIRNRYINHPIYKYELLGVFVGTTLRCIWVVRKITVQGSNCFRLVDMMGSMDGMERICGNVQQFLKECNAEYIDCYNYGIEKEKFLVAGFHMVDGETIIPNYFEPFARQNIDIHYAFNGGKPVVIFKADADQDRPNIVT